MERKVVGLFGLISSGKDVVAKYLTERYGYTEINIGDIVREIAAQMGRTKERYDLQRTQKEMVERYGIDYFAKLVCEKIIENDIKKAVINGIRRPEDATVPKKTFGKEMTLVFVDASAEIRFSRISQRDREGDPKTLDEFLKQEEAEYAHFGLDETKRLADYKIINNYGLDKLYAQVDRLMKEKGLE